MRKADETLYQAYLDFYHEDMVAAFYAYDKLFPAEFELEEWLEQSDQPLPYELWLESHYPERMLVV